VLDATANPRELRKAATDIPTNGQTLGWRAWLEDAWPESRVVRFRLREKKLMQKRKASARGHVVQRVLWVLAGVIAAGVIIIALTLAWSGLAPGLSALVGADRPRDLGAQHSPTDREHFLSKSGIRFEPEVPPSDRPVPVQPSAPAHETDGLDEPRWIDTSFTQEELSAVLNQDAPGWLPLRDMQLRLSDDTVEVSGLLETHKVPGLLKKLRREGTSEADLARISDYVDILPSLVPVYVKVSGAVRGSQLDVALQEVEVGRLRLPVDMLAERMPTNIRETIRRTDHFAIESAIPQDGSIAFSGILPPTILLERD